MTEMRRILITSIEAIIAELDLIQVTLMMARLGGYDEEHFVVCGKNVYSTTLRSMCKNFDIGTPLDSIQIIFDGGPTGHTQFKASVAAFVADRALLCMRKYGRTKVAEIIEEVIAWKEGGLPQSQEELPDECDARYAG